VTSVDADTSTAKPGIRDRVLNVLGIGTLHAIPHIPDRLKRLMMGGRTLTIDGNTLDITMQLRGADHERGRGYCATPDQHRGSTASPQESRYLLDRHFTAGPRR
jgi:hypothetical protein